MKPGSHQGPSLRRPTPNPASRIKRSYSAASVRRSESDWLVELDGQVLTTPADRPLQAPTRSLALAIAAEWAAQAEWIDPQTIPLTRLANVAIDAVAQDAPAVRADLVRYAGSDLLCYRASGPRSLVTAQAAAWDPILLWFEDVIGKHLNVTQGVIFVAQPEATLAAVRRIVEEIASPFELAAAHVMTTLTGSFLLSLAVTRGRLSPEDAWRAAHVDEDEQMRAWGCDAEAMSRRAHRWSEMRAAGELISTLAHSPQSEPRR